MLTYKPEERITISQISEDDWFTETTPNDLNTPDEVREYLNSAKTNPKPKQRRQKNNRGDMGDTGSSLFPEGPKIEGEIFVEQFDPELKAFVCDGREAVLTEKVTFESFKKAIFEFQEKYESKGCKIDLKKVLIDGQEKLKKVRISLSSKGLQFNIKFVEYDEKVESS